MRHVKGSYALRSLRASQSSSDLKGGPGASLHLGGDLLVGDHRGDLLLSDLRLRHGDLMLMECRGDLDRDWRGLPPPLSCVEEGVRLDGIACF